MGGSGEAAGQLRPARPDVRALIYSLEYNENESFIMYGVANTVVHDFVIYISSY